MKISILDQSTASKGRAEAEAIRETLEHARLADRLGYHRYWVSEHHNSASIVGTAPEVLMAAIAATTTRIRIGSAGVMLPHYSALKVAEQFRVLEAIAPGRIDLGVGRAPGSDRLTAYALNPEGDAAAQFPRQVRDLSQWVAGEPLDEGHPFASIVAHPRGPTSPQLWILGSSDYGARLAAQFGLPYAFAYFFTDGRGTEEALDLYRRLFKPSAACPAPKATVCIWALAAATDDEAQRLLASRAHWRVGFQKGLREALLPPDEAAAMQYGADDQAVVDALRRKAFAGTPDRVAAKLHAEAERLGLDEIVLVTWTYDPAARLRSTTLLAQAFGLSGA
ncbi:MAG TPA: LLM class flavin-dependent oxidoreductase [Casimicrobiaceae bacterium]|nr:LLM class flavin-dependent oxidoreductase [Casimicrobiaceae bacterium]